MASELKNSKLDRRSHPDELHHRAADRQALLSVAFNENVDHSEKVAAQRRLGRPAPRRRRRR